MVLASASEDTISADESASAGRAMFDASLDTIWGRFQCEIRNMDIS
jgi:hypothetical protein